MRSSRVLMLFSLVLSSLHWPPASFAQEETEEAVPAKKKKKEYPKSGSLSRSLSAGYSDQAVSEPWGGNDPSGATAAPISGSVSRLGGNAWQMRVFNNSTEETFSVNLAVVQYDSNGRKLRSDNFSYTLKPGQSAERKVAGAANTVDAGLDLVSWRSLTPPKDEEAGEEGQAQTDGAQASTGQESAPETGVAVSR